MMRGQLIEEIVQEENMPRQVNQKKTVANQTVADLFKVS